MFVCGFALSGLLGYGRASMLLLGTLSLGLWVIAVDPQEVLDLNWSARPSPCCHDNVFLIFSEHPWDKLRANLPHLQFLVNDCVYSSHTDIKMCTYCRYKYTTVLIQEILYLASQLWCIHSLTPPTPLIVPPCLPWISYATQKLMLNSCKMVKKQSEAFHTFLCHFSKFKTEFYCISFF